MTPSVSLDELDQLQARADRVRSEFRSKVQEWEDAMLQIAGEIAKLRRRLRGRDP